MNKVCPYLLMGKTYIVVGWIGVPTFPSEALGAWSM